MSHYPPQEYKQGVCKTAKIFLWFSRTYCSSWCRRMSFTCPQTFAMKYSLGKKEDPGDLIRESLQGLGCKLSFGRGHALYDLLSCAEAVWMRGSFCWALGCWQHSLVWWTSSPGHWCWKVTPRPLSFCTALVWSPALSYSHLTDASLTEALTSCHHLSFDMKVMSCTSNLQNV